MRVCPQPLFTGRYVTSSQRSQQGLQPDVERKQKADKESLMQKIRVLGASIALGGVALLSGCVGVPGDPYYSGGYSSGGYPAGYSQPYYADPSPVVVQPAPVYINGGGYYEGRRPYYDRPYYDRRPNYGRDRPAYPYPGVRPGSYPRPGVALPQPGIQQPIRPGGLPATGRPALPNVPGTPIRSTTNPNRDQ
jgi:hypothetical protein